jgi:uracil-DNA glycosylase family protein
VGAERYLPARRTLPALREAVGDCRGCGLWEHATQGVLGEGDRDADLVLVGEQPGDQEDKQGRPFVGPAGRILDQALEQAGIDRDRAYLTNAVKHFKWKARGKRRIHQKPTWSELAACRPWLEAELALLRPHVLVCLGATAAQSLLGKQFRVTRERGVPVESDLAPYVVATIHPSAVLRAPDDEARRLEREGLVDDLRVVAKLLATASRSAA